jgi:cytidine deaminase
VDYKKLVRAARDAKKHSYSPYSRFRVGAALLTTSGEIISGCNIESSSFSLTICAERTALFKALSEGKHKFKAMAISSDLDGFISPCGACRQVILDLAGNIDIVLSNRRGKSTLTKANALLPLPFTSDSLPK